MNGLRQIMNRIAWRIYLATREKRAAIVSIPRAENEFSISADELGRLSHKEIKARLGMIECAERGTVVL